MKRSIRGPRRIVLYRASKYATLPADCASFAEDIETARAYLDNPGFGGALLLRTKVERDDDRILNLADENYPEERLADLCDVPLDTLMGGVETAIPASIELQECLREHGYDWVLVPESYPEDTVTWLWIGPWDREPELEVIDT